MNKEMKQRVYEGTVRSVNLSVQKGTVKLPQPEIRLTRTGVQNDAHNSVGDVQVSLLLAETIESFAQKHHKTFKPGDFAENITVAGITPPEIQVLDRFVTAETEMEVTRLGKQCHGKECAISRSVGDCVMPKEGIFLRVTRPGIIRPGDQIKYLPRVLRFKVITLSDKAAAGEYSDTSGPTIQQLLQTHFGNVNRLIEISYRLLPDDPVLLKQEIETTINNGCDVILTTGGTGVSPRDFTYEVVSGLCDKVLPGIMDFIRIKYGQANPHALLSRAVAGVIGSTLIYTLPGSEKAVREYLAVLLDTMEHLIGVLNGLSH